MMLDSWPPIPLLFAQEGGGNPFASTLTVMLPAVVAMYFLIIMPQQQERKKRLKMIAALKKNDRVLTSAGIYGVVVAVDPAQDRMVIRVDDEKGLKLAVTKSSVSQVLESDKEKG